MKLVCRFCILFCVCFFMFAGYCHAAPKLFMPERRFVFEPVPDGSVLHHDYILKNQGDEPLEILEIGTA